MLRGAPGVGTTIGQFEASKPNTRKLQPKNNRPRLNLDEKGFYVTPSDGDYAIKIGTRLHAED